MGGGHHLLPPDPEKKKKVARATLGRPVGGGGGEASLAPPSGRAGTERRFRLFSQQNPQASAQEYKHSRGLSIRAQICFQSLYPQVLARKGQSPFKNHGKGVCELPYVYSRGVECVDFVWGRKETGNGIDERLSFKINFNSPPPPTSLSPWISGSEAPIRKYRFLSGGQ